ncbi:MAG TPA: winged helix-turn-helix domain-containing protein [Candidatus Limnocylindrales bacterium]|nr:winged helix-turn-helix domain-containing protein [Candidatus Limnocylindrales bacterium]
MGVRLSFPPFTFDRDERVLRRDGRTVPLAPKVAEALALLLAEPGALVEKNALRDALWPDGFVEDGNLTQTIYLIRRALDPDGDGRTFVETIPRRGYRFVPPVSAVEPDRPSALARFAFAARAAAAGLAIVVLSGGVSIGSSGTSPSALTGDAGRAYAVGRYNWNRRTESGVRMAIANFERVVQLAPNDARGYAGLADAYMTTGQWEYTAIASKPVAFRRAESYARHALERDPRSGEALTTLSWLMLDKNNDLDATERMLRTGIALSPNHAPAYEYLGIALLYHGDADGARTALRRSVELDPLSPIDLLWYGRALYYERRFGEARTAFRQVMELDSTFKDAPVMLALADAELGLRDEALHAVASAKFPPDKHDYVAMTAAFVDIRLGRAPRTLPDLRPRKGVHIDAATAAALCLAFGRRDDALAWVKLSFDDPHERISRKMITLDPRLAPLKDDPRFRAITG